MIFAKSKISTSFKMCANVLYESPKLRKRLSPLTTKASSNSINCKFVGKSEMFLMLNDQNKKKESSKSNKCSSNQHVEYYKNYDHDEVPVKDDDKITRTMQDTKRSLEQCLGKGDSRNQIATRSSTSDSNKKISYILKNKSQELQTDDSSSASLDSNIKVFKIVVQEILDKFYASMRDFDSYKKRFHEILAKNRNDNVTDMEDFIKDMIQHITSSSSVINSDKKDAKFYDEKEDELNDSGSNTKTFTIDDFSEHIAKSFCGITNSSVEGTSSGPCNIYLFANGPCVQIKMNERTLLSEININPADDDATFGKEKQVASAENFKKIAEKRMQLEKYILEECTPLSDDIEIPVKTSHGKKNIHLEEGDTTKCNKSETSSYSIIYKICSYFCKRFRKN